MKYHTKKWGKGQRDEWSSTGGRTAAALRGAGEAERGLPAVPAPLQGAGEAATGEAPRHGAESRTRGAAEAPS